MGLFNSLKDMFSTSQVYPSGPEVSRSEDIDAEQEKREKKGLFERVSEKASSVVSSLRNVFRSRAMDVLEERDEILGGKRMFDPNTGLNVPVMTELEKLSQEISLNCRGPVVTDLENNRVIFTDLTHTDDHIDGESYLSRGSIYGSFETKPRRRPRPVSSSIWGEMFKRSKEKPQNRPTHMKSTGTDSAFPVANSVVQRQPLSRPEIRVHSQIRAKYGVEVSMVEHAYSETDRSKEQLMWGLVNRIDRSDELGVNMLVGKYSKSLFSEGKLQTSVLNDYLTELHLLGASSDEMRRIARDTAAYAYVVTDHTKRVQTEMPELESASEDNEGIFKEFDAANKLTEVKVEPMDEVNIDELPVLEVEPIESNGSPSIAELKETSFAGEAEVHDRPKSNFVSTHEANQVDPGLEYDSDSEIVEMEDLPSDYLNGDIDENLRATVPGEDGYESILQVAVLQEEHRRDMDRMRKEYDRKIEKVREEIREEIREEVQREIEGVNRRIDGLETDLGRVDDMVTNIVFRSLNSVPKSDLSVPEVSDYNSVVPKMPKSNMLGFDTEFFIPAFKESDSEVLQELGGEATEVNPIAKTKSFNNDLDNAFSSLEERTDVGVPSIEISTSDEYVDKAFDEIFTEGKPKRNEFKKRTGTNVGLNPLKDKN